ncbi:hypothetical protein [Sphingobacterium sp. NPDC055431]
MKNSIFISILFLMFSLTSMGQEIENHQLPDSSVFHRNNLIFDRIVQQKLMNFPFTRVYPSSDYGILGLMMVLSDDGYFGFSDSKYLKIFNRFYNVMGLRDLDGNEAEIEIESDGTSFFRGFNGNTMSSFKEAYNQMVIRDEAGEVYHLTFDWMSNLAEIHSESGYQLTINKIKSGFEVKDNQNNVAEIKKQKSSVWVATYSNGRVLSTKRGIWNTYNFISEDGKSTLNIDIDQYTNNIKIRNNVGMYLVISNSYNPNLVRDHHHDHLSGN